MTDGQIAKTLSEMIIVVDSREKKNDHILSFFEKQGVKYVIRKMETADYTCEFPNNPKIKQLCINRKKNSLDEICGNFTKHRERFKREFERVNSEKLHLLIENATWKKLFSGTYRSNLPPLSLVASILTWSIRYKFRVWFTNKSESGEVIYNLLKYEYREILKNQK